MHWVYYSNYTKSSTLLRAQPWGTHVHRISIYGFWCKHHNMYIFIDGWYKFYMTVKRNDIVIPRYCAAAEIKHCSQTLEKLLFVLLDELCSEKYFVGFRLTPQFSWIYKFLYWTTVEWSWHLVKLILLSLEQFTLMLLETPQLFPRFVMWEYQRQLKMKTSTFD